jgi:GTPase
LELRRRDAQTDRLSPATPGAALTRAIVLTPFRRGGAVPARGARAGEAVRSPEARLEEAVGLGRAIDLDVVQAGLVPLSETKPGTYFGSGKVDEIAGLVKTLDATLVVVDCALSPVQQRNLEKAWNAKVLDRTGLILEIFGRRARTREGALQVELAHLNYQKSRLVRSWTHLERQRGGFGFLGGPGETQLEADRRVIEGRIARIERDLEGVKRTRKLHRDSRKRVPYPIVALVGYTNAGKSTLFNRLTGAGAYAADQLFATLDPTVRRLALPDARFALLADTVGFVRDLPHELVAAFRSTLQEAREASVLLHIIDAADPNRSERIAQVNSVLSEVGAGSLPQIEVFNKTDLVGEPPRVETGELGNVRRVWLSAQTGQGTQQLVDAIGEFLGPEIVHRHIVLKPEEGRARARFFAAGAVLAEQALPGGGVDLEVSMPRQAFEDLCRTEGLAPDLLPSAAKTCAHPEPFLKSRGPASLAS